MYIWEYDISQVSGAARSIINSLIEEVNCIDSLKS